MSTVQKGFVTLISTLIVGAISVAIAVSLLLLGVGATKTSQALEQSNQAKALANACAEKALNSLKFDLNYAGSETITLGQGTCSIQAVGGFGNINRTIQTTGLVGSIIRKIKVIVAQVQPQIQLQSWQEVADF